MKGMSGGMSAKSVMSSPKFRAKIGVVMHEFKAGKLRSGGKKKVTDRKQAIGIALSEARKHMKGKK